MTIRASGARGSERARVSDETGERNERQVAIRIEVVYMCGWPRWVMGEMQGQTPRWTHNGRVTVSSAASKDDGNGDLVWTNPRRKRPALT